MRILLALILISISARGEGWLDALAKMPFPTNSFEAHLTEPVDLILNSFKPTAEMRAVVLMPAAADHIYFFNWGKVQLPPNPSLLDALNGLTNQAKLRYSFVPPFLLLHMEKDTTSDPFSINPDVSAKFQKREKRGRVYFLDRPYDKVLPSLEWVTQLRSVPDAFSTASYHYYRLSFVGYDLSAADLLRAVAYGTKTAVKAEKKRVVFTDRPFLANP